MTDYEDLLDYRRHVAEIYQTVRISEAEPAETHQEFQRQRNELFRYHPQSALSESQKAAFSGLSYYPYDPTFRFLVEVQPSAEPIEHVINLTDDGPTRIRGFGTITISVASQPVSLSLYWIMGYGGGIFLPFRDLTNRYETYGGGRYLLDTIKHADLGHEQGKIIIDFNYAYNPSCAYNPRWVCPLAPRENWLEVPIPAGEQRFNLAEE